MFDMSLADLFKKEVERSTIMMIILIVMECDTKEEILSRLNDLLNMN